MFINKVWNLQGVFLIWKLVDIEFGLLTLLSSPLSSVLGIEPTTLCVLNKHPATELCILTFPFSYLGQLSILLPAWESISAELHFTVFLGEACLPLLSFSSIRHVLSMYYMLSRRCISSGREGYKEEMRFTFQLQVHQLGKVGAWQKKGNLE